MAVIRRSAVGRGAVVGLGLLAPLALLLLLLDRAGVSAAPRGALAFVVALAAFVLAGFVAGQSAPEAPTSNGMLAGAGALALWAGLLTVIWLLRVVLGRGDAALGPLEYAVTFGGYLLLAAGCGVLGGAIGARMARDDE